MRLILNDEEPIYIQIAKAIEDEILEATIEEEMQIPSTNELAKIYQINPATVLKGINLLVDQDILYKKRGIGMFVKTGAKENIKSRRKESFKVIIIEEFLKEAKKLGIDKEELVHMIMESRED